MLGINFLSNEVLYIINRAYRTMFPSPYWGLFFYRDVIMVNATGIIDSVSVPVLGIIFLSAMKGGEYMKQWYSFPSPY